MFSKIMMLLWERWRRTRWAVIAACLLMLIEQLMLGVGFGAVPVIISFSGAGTGLLLFVLLVGQCELRNLDLRFPQRLFRFPVRTPTLLATNLGYGAVALALPSLIHFGFYMLFSEPISDQQIVFSWNGLLVLETVYMVLQTISWLGGLRAYVFFLAPSLAFLFALPFFAVRFNLPIDTNILCPIIILLCSGISFWNVSADRHNVWINGWQWLGVFPSMFRKRPPRPFASALQAQIWFESRQTGYLFPVAVLCIICPLLVVAIFMKPSSPVLHLFQIAFWPVVVLAEIAGFLVFGVYHRDQASGASSFWLRRPMDTQKLAHAKLRAMIRSITRVLAILTVFALVLVARDWTFGILDIAQLLPAKWAEAFSSPIVAFTGTLFVLCFFASILWTLLRIPIVIIFISQVYWAGGSVARSLRWEALITSLNVLIFVGVLIAFYVAKRRNLISKTTLVCTVCVFAAMVASQWTFPLYPGSKGLLSLNQSQSFFLISMMALPLIPVVATPLLMERLRHR